MTKRSLLTNLLFEAVELPEDVMVIPMEQAYKGIMNDWFVANYDEIPSYEALVKLSQLEHSKNPNIHFKRIDFPEETIYSSWEGDDYRKINHFLYVPSGEDGYERIGAAKWLDKVISYGHESEYTLSDPDEQFNKEFWERPVNLLHGTNDLQGVLSVGILPKNDTRGMTNTGVGAAVFATTEESVAQSYNYGGSGGIVVIDTNAMKTDGYMPRVSQEPDVVEYDMKMSLAHTLGIEDMHFDVEEGIDPNTVIIYGKVPPKYVSQYNG